MKSVSICSVLLLVASVLSAAQTAPDVNFGLSGNDFLRICDAAKPDAEVFGACFGYVTGVIDGIYLYYELHAVFTKSGPPQIFCFRPEVTNGQKFRVVVQFIKTHPEKTDMPTSNLIFHATLDAFPCPKTEPTPPPQR
jgi:hypothetical protein